MSDARLIEMLNGALAWELRAITMYAHYAAYIKGMVRLQLTPMFQGESTESVTHASQVRDAIVKLGGVATTLPANVEIVHTEDVAVMLREALMTERRAADYYREVVSLLNPEEEMYDVIQQIQFSEERSVDELSLLIEG